jgi:hypothetical protein
LPEDQRKHRAFVPIGIMEGWNDESSLKKKIIYYAV